MCGFRKRFPLTQPQFLPNRWVVQSASLAGSAKGPKYDDSSAASTRSQKTLLSAKTSSPKAVRKAIVGGDKAAAQSVFRTSMSTIDTIADKNIIHKNKAARHKSRLSAAVKAMAV